MKSTCSYYARRLGGYIIDEKYFMPSIAFNGNEILYLLICLKIGVI